MTWLYFVFVQSVFVFVGRPSLERYCNHYFLKMLANIGGAVNKLNPVGPIA
jgi:hypothetical protein